MKKRLLCSLAMLTLLGAPVSTTFAQSTDDDIFGELDNDFSYSVDGEINSGTAYSKQNGSSTTLNESYVTLSATWKNKIRAVITGKLEEIFKQNDVSLNEDFSLAEFVKEAFIEIREVNGAPVAIIVGKQPIAFGQNVQAMPFFNNNPLANLQEIDEVMGLTVDLSEGLFGIFDQAELSVYESEAGDLEIGKIDSVSLRLSKMITDQILLTLSHAEQGNSHLGSERERRTSVGLIGESSDGMLVGWVEGLFFSNNPEYPNSSFGITVGGMIKVHETTDVIVEYNYINKEVSQYAVGAKVAVTSNLSVGAEVRYSNYVEKKDDVSVGLTMTYTFGTNDIPQNETPLFGSDD